MKKTNLFLAILLCAVVTIGNAQTIVGSAHDFDQGGAFSWNTTGEICIVCHTPHNAIAGFADAPLWNHTSTAATFTLYSSGTMNATVGTPDGSSKLCLSCHDGTVGKGDFGGITGTAKMSGASKVGTDLSNDHPISFTYDAALATADGSLHNPVTTNSGLGGTIKNDLLISDKMQCSSCHDVHGTANPSLLKKSNAGSALCLTCHNK